MKFFLKIFLTSEILGNLIMSVFVGSSIDLHILASASILLFLFFCYSVVYCINLVVLKTQTL